MAPRPRLPPQYARGGAFSPVSVSLCGMATARLDPAVFVLAAVGSRRHRDAIATLAEHGLTRVSVMPAFALSQTYNARLRNEELPHTFVNGRRRDRLSQLARVTMDRLPRCTGRAAYSGSCLQGNSLSCNLSCVESWFGTSRVWQPHLPCEHVDIYTGEQAYSLGACQSVPGQTLSFLHMMGEITRMVELQQLRRDELVVLLEDDAVPSQGWRRGLQDFVASHPPSEWHLAKLHGDRSSGNCVPRFGTAALAMYAANASHIYQRLASMPVANVDLMLDWLNASSQIQMSVSRERLFWPAKKASTHEGRATGSMAAFDSARSCGVLTECPRAYELSATFRASPIGDECLRTKTVKDAERAAAACERLVDSGSSRRGRSLSGYDGEVADGGEFTGGSGDGGGPSSSLSRSGRRFASAAAAIRRSRRLLLRGADAPSHAGVATESAGRASAAPGTARCLASAGWRSPTEAGAPLAQLGAEHGADRLPRSQRAADSHLVDVLSRLLRAKPPSIGGARPTRRDGRPSTHGQLGLGDLGAGLGQYGRALWGADAASHGYRAWDVGGDAARLSGGLVAYADLSLANDLPRSDWVLSLDVGQVRPLRTHFEPTNLFRLLPVECLSSSLSTVVAPDCAVHPGLAREGLRRERALGQLPWRRDLVGSRRHARRRQQPWREIRERDLLGARLSAGSRSDRGAPRPPSAVDRHDAYGAAPRQCA